MTFQPTGATGIARTRTVCTSCRTPIESTWFVADTGKSTHCPCGCDNAGFGIEPLEVDN